MRPEKHSNSSQEELENTGETPVKPPLKEQRVIRTSKGTLMVTPDEYDRVRRERHVAVTKSMLLTRNVKGNSGDGNSRSDVSSTVIPPIPKDKTTADVALALFNYDEDLLAKTRIRRHERSIYTRAIVSGQGYNLGVLLDYVYTDLTLRIPEDGKARKEILTPYEHSLKGEKTIIQKEKPGF